MLFSWLSFGIEIVLGFVLLDIAIEQRWATISAGLCATLFLQWSSKKKKTKIVDNQLNKENKQGGYGKVQVFKPPILKQLSHPSEILAMLRCKFDPNLKMKTHGSVLGDNGVQDDLNINEKDLIFCHEKLCQVSRSFAQVITFLPNTSKAPLRLSVAIFYLVLRALDTVEDDMELHKFDGYVIQKDKKQVNPAQDCRLIAKQRLLRDFARRLKSSIDNDNSSNIDEHKKLLGFGEGHELELLENIDIIIRVMRQIPENLCKIILDITQEMGDGMADYIARDLRNGTEDSIDFERYCHIAAGTVGDGLTRLFEATSVAPAVLIQRPDLYDSMGSFLQRVNIIRDYLEDMVDGRAWWPKSVWQKYVPIDSQFGHPQCISALAQASFVDDRSKSLACLEHMIADAMEMVPNCLKYLETLAENTEGQVFSFCALPQVMAIATLATCLNNPKVFMGVVKIRKGEAAKIIVNLGLPTDLNEIRLNTLIMFQQYVKIIENKSAENVFKTKNTIKLQNSCEKISQIISVAKKNI